MICGFWLELVCIRRVSRHHGSATGDTTWLCHVKPYCKVNIRTPRGCLRVLTEELMRAQRLRGLTNESAHKVDKSRKRTKVCAMDCFYQHFQLREDATLWRSLTRKIIRRPLEGCTRPLSCGSQAEFEVGMTVQTSFKAPRRTEAVELSPNCDLPVCRSLTRSHNSCTGFLDR